MRRFLPWLLFLFIIFFFPIQTISAPTEVSHEQTLLDRILGIFRKRNIPSDLEKVAKASLPVMNFITAQTGEVSLLTVTPKPEDKAKMDDLDKASSYYTINARKQLPADMNNEAEGSQEKMTLTSNIADFFKKVFGGNTTDKIIEGGNQQAGEYAAAFFPAELSKKIQGRQAQTEYNQEIASENTDSRVLAASQNIFGNKKDDLMENALSAVQCSELPYEVGKKMGCIEITANLFAEKKTPEATVTPVVAIPVSVTPEVPQNPSPGPKNSIPSDAATRSGLNYDLPFYKNSPENISEIDNIVRDLPGRMNSLIVDAVRRRWPLSMIDSWQEVFRISYEKGWNPALIIALWIEETAAGDACDLLYQRGINGIQPFGVSAPILYCSDSVEEKETKLMEQLNAVLGMQKYWNLQTFEQFMCYYGPSGKYPCAFDSDVLTDGWVGRLKDVYSCLMDPSEKYCKPGYFILEKPPVSSMGENISLASALVGSIRDYCRYGETAGQVREENVGCLTDIRPTIAPVPLEIMTISTNYFKYLQCVGFSQAAINTTRGDLLETDRPIAIALDYATILPRGYTFIHNNPNWPIKPGDMPIWDYGTAGHIALVIEVISSRDFKVAEANFDLQGGVREFIKTSDDPRLLGWLRKIK